MEDARAQLIKNLEEKKRCQDYIINEGAF